MTAVFTQHPKQRKIKKMVPPPPSVFRQHFEENKLGRDFIVGDLHGCLDEFERMLKYLSFNPEHDRMFSCGDLVDRGPKSMKCLRLLNYDWFYAVRGNHEQMMLECVLYNIWFDNLWSNAGGDWGAYNNFGKEDYESFRSYLKIIEPKLPFIITVGRGTNRFNVVHAEFTFAPDISDKMIDELKYDVYWSEALLWGRDIINGHTAPHSKDMSITYVGHTPLDDVVKIGKQLYLDGGIVFGGKLHIAEHKAQILHTYDKKTDSYSRQAFL